MNRTSDNLCDDRTHLPETQANSNAPAGSTAPESSAHTRNVLANWAGHLVFVASGFVVPRLIDTHAGPELLGVWDLAWSLVGYVSLMSLGITSAVNRYVSHYRTVGDWSGLNRTTGSCLAVLLAAGGLGLILTAVFAAYVPALVGPSHSALHSVARWIVLLLGASAALQLPAGVLNGVITAYERFELKNAIRAGCHLLTLLVIVPALILGHRAGAPGTGLVTAAAAVLGGQLLATLLNLTSARWVCPQLRLSLSVVRWRTIREVTIFGGKTVLQSVSRILLQHTVGLLTAAFLGPVALAVYARQRMLVMQAARFLDQYAHVFVPVSSALQAKGDQVALTQLLCTTSRYALYICLPIVVYLAIMGGPLVRLWMGADYAAPAVIAVLALGNLASMLQRGTFAILTGIGRHGRAALIELIGAFAGIGLAALLVGWLNWGLIGAAVGVALPLTVVGGIVPPLFACQALDIRFRTYLRGIGAGPLATVVPFIVVLAAARWFYWHQPLLALLVGTAAAGPLLGILYWRRVVPERIRLRVRAAFRRAGPGRARPTRSVEVP